MNIKHLIGKTLKKCKRKNSKYDGDQIIFETMDGEKYVLHHRQDCCEDVHIDDICGDLNDLVGTPITVAEESSNNNHDDQNGGYDSWTWTFYNLGTNKGRVQIKWFGGSNGYYSEEVSFEQF